jgi:hypothetical protein
VWYQAELSSGGSVAVAQRTAPIPFSNKRVVKFDKDGKFLKEFWERRQANEEFMAVHELDCRTDNEIYAGEISNWRVQKLILIPK